MAAQLRFPAQSWFGTALLYDEYWKDGLALSQTGTMDAVGHATIEATGFVIVGVHPLGSVQLDSVGHLTHYVPIPLHSHLEDIHAVDPPRFDMAGRTTIAGNFDFEEPFFVDPPLELAGVGHMALTASDLAAQFAVSKTFSPMAATGRTTFQPVTLQYTTAFTKQLFSLSLPVRGRTTLAGSLVPHTDLPLASTQMNAIGRMTMTSGLFVEGPPVVVIHLGDTQLSMIGGPSITSDVESIVGQQVDLGAVSLPMVGEPTLTSEFFSGGLFSLANVRLDTVGRTAMARTAYSFPGAEIVEQELVAVYEGMEYQEVGADLEDDGVGLV